MASAVYIPIDSITSKGQKGFNTAVPTKDIAVYRRSGSQDFIQSGVIRSGSSGISKLRRAEQEAAKLALEKAVALRKAQEERVIVESQIKANLSNKVKQQLARAYVERQKAQAELKAIERQRQELIRNGSRVQRSMTKDSSTGQNILVSRWSDGKGNIVEQVRNINTGLTTVSSISNQSGTTKTSGVVIGERNNLNRPPKDVVQKIQDSIKSKRGEPTRLEVTGPNGVKFTIPAKGRVQVGKSLAGKHLVFQDGLLMQIDGKNTTNQPLRPVVEPKFFSTERARNALKKYNSKIAVLGANLNLKPINQSAEIGKWNRLQLKRNLTVAERKEEERLRNKIKKENMDAIRFIGLSAAASMLSLGLGSIDLASQMKNNPIQTIKKLPGSVIRGIKEDFNRAKGSKAGALQVATEWITFSAVTKLIGIAAKSGIRQLAKLNPKYVAFEGEQFALRKAPKERFTVRGKERLLLRRVEKPSFSRPFTSVKDFLEGRKPGQFRRFTKDPGLIVKTSTVASGARPLSEQAKLAGKEITAVNASANQITSWLRRKQIIRKPFNLTGLEKKFPNGEASFPKPIRTILKKFDSGIKLSNREFANVNLWLQKNIFSNITLLERSLYLDPASSLRVSRLGIQATPNATLKDILKGNFRLWEKSNKPQVLIFENAKVANFPKELRIIKQKLLANKQLTVAETNKLIRWQVKSGSGRFKPIGSTIYSNGSEFEVTLAPGDMIRRIKRVGFTYIEGRKVNFVTAEIYKPTIELLKKIEKANAGKLSEGAVESLENNLSRKLGRRIRIETPARKGLVSRATRRAVNNTPVLRVRGRGLFVVGIFRRGKVTRTIERSMSRVNNATRRSNARINRSRNNRTSRSRSRSTRSSRNKRSNRASRSTRPNRPTRPTRPGRPRPNPRRPNPKRPKRPSRPTRPNRPGRPGRPRPNPRKKPPVTLRIPKGFSRKNLSSAQDTFYVITRKRGKIVKLYPKPLVMKDARDFLAYSIDNNLTKTAWFVPLGRTRMVIRPPKKIEGYFSKVSHKLRPYRIRFGKKKNLLNGFIEKRKFFIDTQGERRQARRTNNNRRMINRRTIINRRIIRRRRTITPTQRRILIQRLRLARAARMRNLRRR